MPKRRGMLGGCSRMFFCAARILFLAITESLYTQVELTCSQNRTLFPNYHNNISPLLWTRQRLSGPQETQETQLSYTPKLSTMWEMIRCQENSTFNCFCWILEFRSLTWVDESIALVKREGEKDRLRGWQCLRVLARMHACWPQRAWEKGEWM